MCAPALLRHGHRSFEQALADEGQGGDKQLERVRSLFHRQLQMPGNNMDALLAEYEAWEGAHGKACAAARAESWW